MHGYSSRAYATSTIFLGVFTLNLASNWGQLLLLLQPALFRFKYISIFVLM